MAIKVCPICSKEFGENLKPSAFNKRRYCSDECSAKARHIHDMLARPKVYCEYCGKEFGSGLRPAISRKQRFCSKSCKERGTRPAPTAVCPICGITFDANSNGKGKPRKTFCSRQCAGVGNRIPKTIASIQADKINQRKKAAKQKLDLILFLYPIYGAEAVATMLGLTTLYVRRLANNHHVTLSPIAAQRIIHEKAREYMTDNNPMKHQEIVDKVKQYHIDHPEVRENTMQAMRQGQSRFQKDQPSSLEFRLRQYLDDMGVQYEPSAIIKAKFVVDIRIGNFIIETDGDYWHGHPRFEPLTERQIKQRQRDASRNKYLTACGYTVIRIWESDMTKDNVKQILFDNGIVKTDQ